jgi:hypothetical protein
MSTTAQQQQQQQNARNYNHARHARKIFPSETCKGVVDFPANAEEKMGENPLALLHTSRTVHG